MVRLIPFIILLFIVGFLFRQSILRGYIPIPADYMVSWYEPWKAETTVGGVPMIVHKPVVDDAFRHLYPLRVIASDLMKQGQFPLWNPYNAGGTPLLAIIHPGYLTPFGLVFLVLPATIAWTVYIMLQPLVLGLSTYWYGRMLKLSVRGALFAAAALILAGFSVVRLEYGEFLYVLSGLPLLLGIVERIRMNTERPGAVWIPVVTALVIVSGQPHMVIYTLGITGLYIFLRLPVGSAMRYMFRIALGVGIAAAVLLPGFELFSRATINRSTSGYIFDRFLLPVSHLLTVLIPNFFGNQATYNYFGPHDYTETAAYIGMIPVFFAAVAVFLRWKSGTVRFFAALAIIAVLTTLRWPGARWLFSLPIPVLSSDVPSRVFVISTFAVAILSGMGITEWEKLSKGTGYRFLAAMGVVAAGVFGIALYWYLRHSPCPVSIPACRMVSIRNTIVELAGFFVFAASAFAAFVFVRRKAMLSWIPFAVVILLGLYNAGKFLPFSPAERVFPAVPVLTALKAETGTGRYFGIGSAAFRTNLTAYYGLYSLDYFDPLHIRRYAELVSYVNTGSRTGDIQRSDIQVVSDASPSGDMSLRRDRFLDMTGTSALVLSVRDATPSSGAIAWQDANWRIVRRPSALPRAYITTDIRMAPDPGDELERMFSPDTDIAGTAFVEEPVSGVDIGSPAQGSADVVSYEPNRVSIRVSAPAAAFLVLSDTYYPGWKAVIDGARKRKSTARTIRSAALRYRKGSMWSFFRTAPTRLRMERAYRLSLCWCG